MKDNWTRHPEYRLLADKEFSLEWLGERHSWMLKAGERCEYFEHSDTYLFNARDGVVPFFDAELVENSPQDFAPVNYFVLQGAAEHLDFFQNNASYNERSGALQWFWTVPKQAVKGETAFIYLCAPESRIAGRVEIVGEPFFNSGDMFENPIMREKWCAEIAFRAYYASRSELTMKGLRALFIKDWNWLRYPRGNTKLPAQIWKPFFELTLDQEKVNSRQTACPSS